MTISQDDYDDYRAAHGLRWQLVCYMIEEERRAVLAWLQKAPA